MVLYPEVQAKAQAEIDRVVGKNRLPDFDDRSALPYLDAVLRETLRWHPVFPMGLYTLLVFLSRF
jgi:cytochrome P450